jgi:hypothetical protein
MLAECYRVDVADLIAALCSDDLMRAFQASIVQDIPSLADRSMLLHLRRMHTLASQVIGDGFDRLAERDRAAADALLTDLFAVATYHGWQLPVQALGSFDLPLEGLPRGLLGADQTQHGALLVLTDVHTVALARSRVADDVADVSSHPRH